MSGRELFDALRNVDGVRKVDWLTAKWAQENVLVRSEQGGPYQKIEFAVTRHQHMKDPDAPKTVTVMFKEPPLYLHAEAWRILRAVVRGKALLPVHVQQYMAENLARRSGFLAPGSASAFSAAGSSAVARPAAPANPAANDLPQDGSTKEVEMAGASTLPTSPNAAAPPQKDESGAQAAEAAHGGCLPSQWPAEESACASGASCEPMSGQDLRVDALAEDGAARAVYAAILRDMSPPWLLHSFSKAPPGNGALSKCTRPCFLTWGVDLARLVLGSQVQSHVYLRDGDEAVFQLLIFHDWNNN